MIRIIIGHLAILASGLAFFYGLIWLHIRVDTLFYGGLAATYTGVGIWAAYAIRNRSGLGFLVGFLLISIIHAVVFILVTPDPSGFALFGAIFLVGFGTLIFLFVFGVCQLIKSFTTPVHS